jgi:hypothetical protein
VNINPIFKKWFYGPARGVNLLDLAIGLTLLALVSHYSWPLISTFNQGLKVKAQASSLAENLTQLSQQAVLTRQKYELVTQPDSYRTKDSNGELVSETQLRPGTSLHSKPASIHFFPSGSNSPASLTLNNRGHSCKITLSLRGRISKTCISKEIAE